MHDVAVVIITKNLEWNVTRALDSVYRAIPGVGEVVLVDSASTDGTVDLALAYPKPITVCQLDPDQRLTAAAGRAVGQANSDSDFILFLDGDCELIEGFADVALDVLRSHDDIGVVGGTLINLPKTARSADHADGMRSGTDFTDVFHASGGCALYRRSVLELAGGFSVRVFSDEEPALAVRIRHHGYRVVRVDHSSAFHYTDPIDKVSTLVRRRGRNLWIGHGQNLREFAGTPMLGEYVRNRGHGLLPALAILLLGVSVAASMMRRSAAPLVVAGVGAVGLFAVLAGAKRSVSGAAFTVVKRFVILEGTVRGLADQPVDGEVSIEYEVLR